MSFKSFSGKVTNISDYKQGQDQAASGCFKLMTVEGTDGSVVNFVVAPNTYFVDHPTVFVGDSVTGFYDANAPVPQIYPPQYRAIVMTKNMPGENVKVDYFNSQLVSSDGSLKLNIGRSTQILLPNDQRFSGRPANRNLIVVYGPVTRSIPAQTTPFEIIVMC